MSKLYIDITKDRVYVERKDSRERRSAQTAMYIILSSLTRLIAPVLSFTADEIWRMMPHASSEDKRSVLLNDMPAFNEGFVFVELEERYNKLFALREDIMKALELARAEKLIGKSLDAKLTIYAAGDELELLREFSGELATICIVSQVIVSDAPSPQNAFACADHPVGVVVGNADGEKCDRCWMYTTDVTDDGEGRVCRRCKKIVG